jgi:hypothetical protein
MIICGKVIAKMNKKLNMRRGKEERMAFSKVLCFSE